MYTMEKGRTVCGELADARLPRWSELPDIELYMDQVVALMSKYMLAAATSGDKLTPSMVNNYVKMGIMPPPVKKKYSRSHLVHLIIICLMKQVMPMVTIGRFIKTGLESLSEEQLLDMTAGYYESAASACAARGLEQAAALEDREDGLNILAARAAIRSQIELSLAEKLSAE